MAYGNFGGGFGGGNLNQLMRQAQKMQEDMARAKKEIEENKKRAVAKFRHSRKKLFSIGIITTDAEKPYQ